MTTKLLLIAALTLVTLSVTGCNNAIRTNARSTPIIGDNNELKGEQHQNEQAQYQEQLRLAGEKAKLAEERAEFEKQKREFAEQKLKEERERYGSSTTPQESISQADPIQPPALASEVIHKPKQSFGESQHFTKYSRKIASVSNRDPDDCSCECPLPTKELAVPDKRGLEQVGEIINWPTLPGTVKQIGTISAGSWGGSIKTIQ